MTENVKIIKDKLSDKNNKLYKKLFEKCFDEKWESNIPFADDNIYTVISESGSLVGFCFVHNSPPYNMGESGSFLYNLCVDTNYRNLGIATALIDSVLLDHPKCYCHMLRDSKLMKNWKKIGVWRDKFVEYATGFSEVKTQVDMISSDHYDAKENIIYL